MIIGGLRKISLIDYPGFAAGVVFTRGCNFRCAYCHNYHLVYPEYFNETIPIEDVVSYFHSVSGKIEAAVVSGGEPTIHADLPELFSMLKSCGLKTKLDTNGSNPGMLRLLIEKKLLDFIAMDIKAEFEDYNKICGCNINTEDILESISVIKTSGLNHHFRTTYVKYLLRPENLKGIKKMIMGSTLIIQNYKPPAILNEMNKEFEVIAENEFKNILKKV
jgi:pyruvate formate lyase activating enzyme